MDDLENAKKESAAVVEARTDFDTSMLGPTWNFDNLQLIDNNQGTIFLTGLSNTVAGVPEPGTAVLATLGLLGLIGFRRRRRR